MLAGGRLTYAQKGIEASLWNQFVSKQYMSNEGLEAHTLPSYHIANARLGYTFEYDHTNTVQLFFEARNLANTSYAANGYMWGATPYYYAQATRNYMFGLTFMF
jgi:iron complex outermembrane receptor protein